MIEQTSNGGGGSQRCTRWKTWNSLTTVEEIRRTSKGCFSVGCLYSSIKGIEFYPALFGSNGSRAHALMAAASV